jgi:hypothetical protein
MAILLSALNATTPAFSQEESVAESLFRQARDEMKRGEHVTACPKLEESYRLDPAIGTLLNLALCREALGNLAMAWSQLRQVVDSASVGDSRLPFARRELAKIESELPWVHLVLDHGDDQTIVQLDKVELRSETLSRPIPVNPGAHLVRVARPTGEANEQSFSIGRGETLELHVAVPPQVAPPVVLPPSISPGEEVPPPPRRGVQTVSPRPAPRNNGRERALAYGLGAVGAAGLVTSGAFGWMALHDRNALRERCPDHECATNADLDRAKAGSRNAQLASVAFVVGAVGLALSVALFWHSGRATAGVSLGPNSASLSFGATLR